MEFATVLLSAYSFWQNWPGGWVSVAVLATIIAVIINATLLMFARGFNLQELERFSKSEILQAVATAMMAILLVGLVGGVQSFIYNSEIIHGESQCGGEKYKLGLNEEGIFSDSLDYVRCTIQLKARNIAEVQGSVTSGADAYFAFNALNMQFSIIGVTIFRGDWISALFEMTEKWRIINNLSTVLLIGLNSISFLVLYVKQNMLHLFLPLGIIMRAFYFTRGPGAFLMAVAIGMYFVFPVMYILLDPGFVPTPIPKSVTSMSQTQNLCYPTISAATTIVSIAQSSAPGATLVASSLQGQLSQAYISLILHPLIAFSITLAFIRYLMTILGGNTYELMKLVTKVI
jgi:hypothetical protein